MKAKLTGFIERVYESFLGLPVPVVLVLLWLAGAVLLGICAALLYSFWSLLQAVAEVSEDLPSPTLGV